LIPIRVLVLENHPEDAWLMINELRRSGFDPTWQRVVTEASFLSRLDEGCDLILSDCALPQFTGFQALEAVRARRLDVPFILVSGTISEDVAAEAMRNGADDYVSKNRLDRLGRAAQEALRRKRERDEAAQNGAKPD
jgi:pentatricopeptide repeat protein